MERISNTQGRNKETQTQFFEGIIWETLVEMEDIYLVVEDIQCTDVDRFIWLRTGSRGRIWSPFHFTIEFICSLSDNTVINSDCKMSNNCMTINNGEIAMAYSKVNSGV